MSATVGVRAGGSMSATVGVRAGGSRQATLLLKLGQGDTANCPERQLLNGAPELL